MPCQLFSRTGREEELHRRLLAAELADPPPYPASFFSGRGIVVCAGGERCFTNAWIHLNILRHRLGCGLPVEVWHFGPREWSPVLTALLQPLGVRVVDGSGHVQGLPEAEGRGFALKIAALRHSSFREVLFLDVDNVPVRDPAFLFADPSYLRTGALFWKDIRRTDPSSRIWALLDLDFEDRDEWESGQLVLDKEKWWRPLCVVAHLNAHFPFYYRHIFGDKQTFQLAARLTGWPACEVPWMPELVEANRHQSMLNQFAPDGSLLFHHRTQADWNLFGTNPRIPGFAWENECRELLEALRERWTGEIHSQPGPWEQAEGLASRPDEPRWFHYCKKGAERKHMEFLPGGGIGHGAGWDGQSWELEEGRRLVLRAHGLEIARLEPEASGVWRGKRSIGEEMEISLIPMPPPAEDPPAAVSGGFFWGRKSLGPAPGKEEKEWRACREAIRRILEKRPGWFSRSRRMERALDRWSLLLWRFPQWIDGGTVDVGFALLEQPLPSGMARAALSALLAMTARSPGAVWAALPGESARFWPLFVRRMAEEESLAELSRDWLFSLASANTPERTAGVLEALAARHGAASVLLPLLRCLAEWRPLAFSAGALRVLAPALSASPEGAMVLRALLLSSSGREAIPACEIPPDFKKMHGAVMSGRIDPAAAHGIAGKVAEILEPEGGRGSLLLVHNIQGGHGDEIIRVAGLVQSLSLRFPGLAITVVTERPFLYNHPSVRTLRWRNAGGLEAALAETPAGVVSFHEPWREADCSDEALEEEVRNHLRRHPPRFFLEARKGHNHFTFQTLRLEGREWAGELGLDCRMMRNAHAGLWCLAVELGWGAPRALLPGARDSVLVGKPDPGLEACWRGLAGPLREEGARAILLVNPFGGQRAEKGFLPEHRGQLARWLERWVEEGFGIVLMAGDPPWGARACLEEVRLLIPEPRRGRVAIEPERLGELGEAGDGWSEKESLMRARQYFAAYADEIVSVEGWLAHLAALLGKPCRIWLAGESSDTEWHPLAPRDSVLILDDLPQAGWEGCLGDQAKADLWHRPFRHEKNRLLAVVKSWLSSTDARVSALLLELARHPDREIRRMAYFALAGRGERRHAATVQAGLADGHHLIRAAAAEGMLRSGRRYRGFLKDTLRAHVLIGCLAWDELDALGAAAVPALERGCGDSDPLVRRDSALVLRRILARSKNG